jgi:phage gp36-like protein
MTFATRADLLARSSAHRLEQLAVPTDAQMFAEGTLRTAIEGGDLSGLAAVELAVLNLALAAIDGALGDASELMVSYSVPATAASPLIARLCSTIALYYLQNAERMTADESKAYEGAVATLRAHNKGEINLLPLTPAEELLVDDQVQFVSEARRYGSSAAPVDGW